MSQADSVPTTTLSTDELSDLTTRLVAHADNLTNPARLDVGSDLQLAATVLRRVAGESDQERPKDLLRLLKREIARVAGNCSDRAAGARLLEIIGVDGGWGE